MPDSAVSSARATSACRVAVRAVRGRLRRGRLRGRPGQGRGCSTPGTATSRTSPTSAWRPPSSHRALPGHAATTPTWPGSTSRSSRCPRPMGEGVPDLSYIEAAAATAGAAHHARVARVILESTTYPGTTEELVAPILEQGSGLQAGADFHLGYSPERIDPGNATWRLENTPKVVSGVDAASLRARCKRFFDHIVDATVPVSRHPGGRAHQAAREHLPPREHRAGQRAGDVRPRPGHRRVGGHRRRLHQAVRLHALHPRPRRRRPLPADRPVVPVVAGRAVARPDVPVRRAGQRRQRAHAGLRGPARCSRLLNDQGKAVKGSTRAGLRPGLQGQHRRRPRDPVPTDRRAAAGARRRRSCWPTPTWPTHQFPDAVKRADGTADDLASRGPGAVPGRPRRLRPRRDHRRPAAPWSWTAAGRSRARRSSTCDRVRSALQPLARATRSRPPRRSPTCSPATARDHVLIYHRVGAGTGGQMDLYPAVFDASSTGCAPRGPRPDQPGRRPGGARPLPGRCMPGRGPDLRRRHRRLGRPGPAAHSSGTASRPPSTSPPRSSRTASPSPATVGPPRWAALARDGDLRPGDDRLPHPPPPAAGPPRPRRRRRTSWTAPSTCSARRPGPGGRALRLPEGGGRVRRGRGRGARPVPLRGPGRHPAQHRRRRPPPAGPLPGPARPTGSAWFRRKALGGMGLEDDLRRAANRLRYRHLSG